MLQNCRKGNENSVLFYIVYKKTVSFTCHNFNNPIYIITLQKIVLKIPVLHYLAPKQTILSDSETQSVRNDKKIVFMQCLSHLQRALQLYSRKTHILNSIIGSSLFTSVAVITPRSSSTEMP